MDGLQRHLLWGGGVGLAAFAGYVLLRPELAPADWSQALIATGSVIVMFGLGVIGLALIRTGDAVLMAPGIGALCLSIVSLASACRGFSELSFLGVFDFSLSGGLLLRVLRLRRLERDRRPPANDV